MRLLILSAVALIVSACDSPRIEIRQRVEPAQHTVAQLLIKYDTATFPECRFPGATSFSQQTIVSQDSALRLAIRGVWRRSAADPGRAESAEARWRRTGGGTLELARVLNGAIGPAWLVTPSRELVAHPTCMQKRGDAGAIWRRYDSADSSGAYSAKSYDALAEVITRDSLRYHFSVHASSAELRDSLAAQVSRAILETNAP